jgi:hypothetical protein
MYLLSFVKVVTSRFSFFICLHLIRTCWPIIQKVRSHHFIKHLTWAAYKTTNLAFHFLHSTYLYRLYIIFRLRGRFPFIQTDLPFYFKAYILLSFTLLVESRLIYFPEANKIFQFTSFLVIKIKVFFILYINLNLSS